MAKERKLGRPTSHRLHMLRNLTTSLLREEEIITTLTRAKETRRMAEKMITLAKKGDLHSRREALRVVYDKEVVKKLFDELGPKYQDRKGGYTRILKMGPRRGDGAERAIIQLV